MRKVLHYHPGEGTRGAVHAHENGDIDHIHTEGEFGKLKAMAHLRPMPAIEEVRHPVFDQLEEIDKGRDKR